MFSLIAANGESDAGNKGVCLKRAYKAITAVSGCNNKRDWAAAKERPSGLVNNDGRGRK